MKQSHDGAQVVGENFVDISYSEQERDRFRTNMVIGLVFTVISTMLFWMDMHSETDNALGNLKENEQLTEYIVHDGHAQ